VAGKDDVDDVLGGRAGRRDRVGDRHGSLEHEVLVQADLFGELPVQLVLNKVDAVDPLGRRRLANRFPDALLISALTGEGLDELRARIAERFAERLRAVRLLVPYEDGKALAALYELGAPIEERMDTAEGVLVVAQLPQREVPRFAPFLVSEPPARARSR
jgi:GTP-binding protein HflX